MLKKDLIDYLKVEKAILEKSILQLKELPRDNLIEKGLIIPNIVLKKTNGSELIFSAEINNSKFNSGDRVTLYCKGKSFEATIIENFFSELYLSTEYITDLSIGAVCEIKARHFQLLDPVISLYEKIDSGYPGWTFLKTLEGSIQPRRRGNGSQITESLFENKIFSKTAVLSKSQEKIIRKAVDLPSLYAIQGPPGTGKSFILAIISDILHSSGKRVLILGHTHSAVNNCLSAIHKQNPSIPLVKIGESLKSSELPNSVDRISFRELNLGLKRNKYPPSSIIGMTFVSSVLNLGLKTNVFNPNVIMVDEAAQLPLTLGALTGVFGAGSHIFFGDDKQMLPIYQPELIDDQLSCSIFEKIRSVCPEQIDVLDVTYRMNEELTNFIGMHFYKNKQGKPFLRSSNEARSKKIQIKNICKGSSFVQKCLSPNPSIIHVLDNEQDISYTQQNKAQAKKIGELTRFALNNGVEVSEIAIVTPFRKQVAEIRKHLKDVGISNLPLIDTVERIQGVTVDLVLISLCATDPAYLRLMKQFIFSPNRINVSISRARKKAIIFGEIGSLLN